MTFNERGGAESMPNKKSIFIEKNEKIATVKIFPPHQVCLNVAQFKESDFVASRNFSDMFAMSKSIDNN